MRFPEFMRSAGLASNDRPLAGEQGLEPQVAVLETAGLPLTDSPIWRREPGLNR